VRRVAAVATATASLGVLVAPTAATAETVPPAPLEHRVIGWSVQGRPIVARRFGHPGGTVVVAVGTIHGDELSGMQVARALATGDVPSGFDLWVVRDANPDGTAANRRRNARGIDLNRNFGVWWAPTECPGPYCSGPAPASEPESRALAGFLIELQPRLVVFFHSEGPHVVDRPERGLRRTDVLHAYADGASASVANLHCGLDSCTGNATQFVNRSIAGATSFVVELPCHDRCLPPRQVERHVRGFWAAARAVAAD
jgi:protein MpaA